MHDELCGQIRYWHRQRVFAMEQRKRANLALGAFLRMALGWSLAIPKEEQEAIRARAAMLQDIGDMVAKQMAKPVEKRAYVPRAEDADFMEWSGLIAAAIASRTPFDQVEAEALKQMKALAKQLPVWGEWAEGVRGFGEASLAVVIAEAGDLSVYPKKGHLWKRMGLAVIDGTRQGGLSKTASKDEWIEHGYNRERRSRMWNIGDTLIKAQGPYREVYLARKEYERTAAEAAGLSVAPSAKIPAKRADEFVSDGHIHRRAQRYMEKRLLRDLWQAWNHRKATLGSPETAEYSMPTDAPFEREADARPPSRPLKSGLLVQSTPA